MQHVFRATALPWLVLTLWLPLAIHVLLKLWFTWGYSGVRLVRSMGIWLGETLFPAQGEGWIHLSLYGPVAAFAYIPVGYAPGPAAAILIGQLLSLAYYLLPAVALLWAATRASPEIRWAAFVFFLVMTLDLWALTYSAFTAHSDSPTLALSALACFSVLRWQDRPIGLALAVLLTTLALWSKQVAIGVPFAIATYVLFRFGFKSFLRLAGWGVAIGGSVTTLIVLRFGPLDNMLFHLVTVPGLHSWRWGGGLSALNHAAGLMLHENLALIVLALGFLVPQLARRPVSISWREWVIERPWILLWWIAACQFPFALVGRVKVGGDVNSNSHSLYFLLLGLAMALAQAGHGDVGSRKKGSSPEVTWYRFLLYGVPVITILAIAVSQEPEAFSKLRRGYDFDSHPYERARAYLEDHPETVYLPRMNLVTFFAEQRLDHQLSGIVDLHGAGKDPSPEHLRAFLPPKMEKVAMFADHTVEQVRDLQRILELDRLPDDPLLPGFWLFASPDSPAFMASSADHDVEAPSAP